MKKVFVGVMVSLAIFCISLPAQAENVADVEKMQTLILQALDVYDGLGEESYAAFDDPNGEFVIRDDKGNYVMNVGLADCDQGLIVSSMQGKGLKTALVVEPGTGRMLLKEACEIRLEQGRWINYNWPNPDDKTQLQRRVLLYFPVPNSSMIFYIGAVDDVHSAEDLNNKLK